jgi:hypothetical protein
MASCRLFFAAHFRHAAPPSRFFAFSRFFAAQAPRQVFSPICRFSVSIFHLRHAFAIPLPPTPDAPPLMPFHAAASVCVSPRCCSVFAYSARRAPPPFSAFTLRCCHSRQPITLFIFRCAAAPPGRFTWRFSPFQLSAYAVSPPPRFFPDDFAAALMPV